MTAKDIIFIMIAYLLGGVCVGYYLVHFRLGLDLHEEGSGGVGARNVGRLLGRSGFITTMMGDGLKGVVAVFLARRFELEAPVVSLVVVAVIAGHVWPLPLHFRGGRGISTAVGAYLAYDPVLVLLLLGLVVGLMIFRRGLILSGLAAFLLLPIVVYSVDAFAAPGHGVAALAGSAGIILFAHRDRVRKAFAEALSEKEI